MDYKKNILCIGAGYVGGPTMAMIAYKCPQYKVTLVDINSQRIEAWNSDQLPIFEPGLDSIVKTCKGKNLFFSTNIESEIKKNDIIFVAVNTPTKDYGVGAGMAADLQYFEKTARQIVACAETSKIIIEKSTLPVKSAQVLERILEASDSNVQFDVLSNPEFLAEGTAMNDLENPDRVLIGSRETEAGIRARNELVEIYANWVPKDRIITSNIWSSELSKLIANAFLAQRVSSINAVSALCEVTRADVTEVANAVGMDSRIGSKFLQASVGFGGSCFKKDILNLVYICRSYGLNEPADYWEQVIKINQYQQDRFVFSMIRSMFNTLAGRKICLFGAAFKANTDDTRESPAISIAKRLVEEKAHVVVTDPRALNNFEKNLIDYPIEYEDDPYIAANAAHAIGIITEWDIYKSLDYEKIYRSMVKPAFIFDGRNIIDRQHLFKIGFNVFAIGKPELTHYK